MNENDMQLKPVRCVRCGAALGRRQTKYCSMSCYHPTTVEGAFWAKVTKTPSCWLWTGATQDKGYGTTAFHGRSSYVHRLSYEMHHGPIPNGMAVDHTCWNRRCVNPAHLRLTTTAENQQNRSGASIISQTGVRGVYPTKGGRYVVQVMHKHIGTFSTLNDAEAAAVAARQKMMPFSVADQQLAGGKDE